MFQLQWKGGPERRSRHVLGLRSSSDAGAISLREEGFVTAIGLGRTVVSISALTQLRPSPNVLENPGELELSRAYVNVTVSYIDAVRIVAPISRLAVGESQVIYVDGLR